MARRVLVLAFAALAVSVAPAGAQSRPGLVPFDSCAQLTRYARRNVVRAGGREGVPFTGDVMPPGGAPPAGDRRRCGDEAMPVAARRSSRRAGTGGGSDPQFSTTNVQEAGIDEADIVKTDGRSAVRRPRRRAARLRRHRAGAAAGRPAAARRRPAPAAAARQAAPRASARARPRASCSPRSTSRRRRRRRSRGRWSSPGSSPARGCTAGPRGSSSPRRPSRSSRRRPRRCAGARRDDHGALWLPRTTIRSRITRRTFRRSVVAVRRRAAPARRSAGWAC